MANQDRILNMSLLLAACIGVGIALREELTQAVLANPMLNGLILLVLLFGIIYNIRRVLSLSPDVQWLTAMAAGESPRHQPRLLGPIARMMDKHRGHLSLTTVSMRSLADGVGSRLQDGRETSRYMIGLLIFLGLLGTFWGLLGTISAIADLVAALDAGRGDLTLVISDLRNSLERPLGDMATAFSSSLLGLAGSLILGFLDLQAGQAQGRFFNALEDWLSDITRLSGRSSDEDAVSPAYLAALLEQTAGNMLEMKDAFVSAETMRRHTESVQLKTLQSLEQTIDLHRETGASVRALVDTQNDLRQTLLTLAGQLNIAEMRLDDSTRNHIRNTEVVLRQLLEDTQSGRHQTLQELRSDLRLLARAIAALADARDIEQAIEHENPQNMHNEEVILKP